MTRNDTLLLAAMRDAARHLEPLSHLAAVRARDTLLRALSAHDAVTATLAPGPRDADGREVDP